MRVVFVNRFFYPDHSATSQLLSDLAFKCAKWGFETRVITSRQRYDDPSVYLPVSETVGGVEIQRVNGTHYGRSGVLTRMFDYVSFVTAARKKLSSVVENGTVVVAKTDPPMLGMLIGSTVRKRGGILVNWLQDVFPETFAALHPQAIVKAGSVPLREARNRSLHQARLNIVIGDRMMHYLRSIGIPSEKLRFIPNWPYDKNEPSRPKTEPFRNVWDLDGRFVVGYFGNLGRVHEWETILGAMRVLRNHPEIVFLFVGGGHGLERLMDESRRLGLTNLVHKDYVPREDLQAALAAPDVHLVVLRPELEGFVVPSKFAGVAAAHKPVLYVGDAGGEIGSIVETEKCGHVVATGDFEGLAETIKGLARNPENVGKLGRNAGRVYRERFQSEAIFRQWRSALEGLEQGYYD